MEDLTINWSRAIHVDGVIDDELLIRLTPRILQLRQESSDPITVGINSPGGSVSTLKSLRGLIIGPDQNGAKRQMITVVTDHAYSAAATLLALGDYAVGLKHAEILFHDTRFGGLADVTPSVALDAAKVLQKSNETASLDLAHRMFSRWMWNYLDFTNTITENKAKYPAAAKEFSNAVSACQIPSSPQLRFDLTGLCISIFARLTPANECLIENATDHLMRWGLMSTISGGTSKYASNSGGTAGILDGVLALYKQFNSTSTQPFDSASNEEDINLFLIIAMGRIAASPEKEIGSNLDRALSDFRIFKLIDDKNHVAIATKQIIRNRHIFLTPATSLAWEEMDKQSRDAVIASTTPIVRVAWLLCMLVARELFNGEHTLKPHEAMALGLIDEVPGPGGIESRRQFRMGLVAKNPPTQKLVPRKVKPRAQR